MTNPIQFGTISRGTLHTEDLLDAFACELDYLVSHGAASSAEHADRLRALVQEAQDWTEDSEADGGEIVMELQDALNELCPSYTYFGAHEGDGSDFGFWPCIDALEDAVSDGEVLKLNAGDEIPADYTGEVMFVTDHGNVSFGYVDETSREFVEVWGCV